MTVVFSFIIQPADACASAGFLAFGRDGLWPDFGRGATSFRPMTVIFYQLTRLVPGVLFWSRFKLSDVARTGTKVTLLHLTVEPAELADRFNGKFPPNCELND